MLFYSTIVPLQQAATDTLSCGSTSRVCTAGLELGPGAAGLILQWADASTTASGISALDAATKGSVPDAPSEGSVLDTPTEFNTLNMASECSNVAAASSSSSAVDAFKRSVMALADGTGRCSAAASLCVECIRNDGNWNAECLERFCHLFHCLDKGHKSGECSK